MRRSIDPTTRRQLRTILAQFYPDESSIRRVAADAGIDLSRVLLNSHPTNDWHRVLAEAEFVNQLDALLDVLEGEYAANTDVQRICEIYRQETMPVAENLVTDVERVGDQQTDSQVLDSTIEDDVLGQSGTDVVAQETFQIESAVRNHPDFAALLRQSDFVPKEERNGRELIVVRPKVAITCRLPIAISGGSCQIEFSDPFLRNLAISLEHKKILQYFVAGRNTPFHWKTRKFIDVLQNGEIRLSIDPLEVPITKADAIDLCECVDIVIDAYVSIVMEAENELEAWKLPIGRQYVDNDEYGYEILTVSVETWRQMLQFARDFPKASPLEVNLYECQGSIQIETHVVTHAEIVPKALFSSDGLPSEEVTLLYLPPKYDKAWREHIGSKGIWTVDFTRAWLLNQLFPLLQNPYFREPLNSASSPDVFWKIADTRYLRNHVTEIHRWASSGHDITQYMLINYCKTFAQLISQTTIEEKSNTYGYIIGRIVDSEAAMKNKDNRRTYREENLRFYQKSLQSPADLQLRHESLCSALKNNVRCLEKFEYIEHSAIDYLLRAHQVLLQDIKINATQSAINRFKKALWPLFERASFGNRFVRDIS